MLGFCMQARATIFSKKATGRNSQLTDLYTLLKIKETFRVKSEDEIIFSAIYFSLHLE